ncbi:MAG: hypothetical protein H0T11_09240 [Chthoniobacterales bacterium]|nr:hypothetical protein [Chthoniobacterales bacterium]
MKTLSVLFLGIVLSGCTTTTSTTTPATTSTTTRSREFTNNRTYTREDLDRTGHQNVGESLETLDPSVNSIGR